MARRRRNRTGRAVALVIIVVAVVAISASFFDIGIEFLEVETFEGIPFQLALVPFEGVNCSAWLQAVTVFTDGTKSNVQYSTRIFQPLIPFDVFNLAGSKEVSRIDYSIRMRCVEAVAGTAGSLTLDGGIASISWQARDGDGSTKLISGSFKSQSLPTGTSVIQASNSGGVILLSGSLSGTQIDNILQSTEQTYFTVVTSNNYIDAKFKSSLTSTIQGGLQTAKISWTGSIDQQLRIINEVINPPQPTDNRVLIASETISPDPMFDDSAGRLTVRALLPEYQSAESFPRLTVKTPTSDGSKVIASNVIMSVKSGSGSTTQFANPTLVLPATSGGKLVVGAWQYTVDHATRTGSDSGSFQVVERQTQPDPDDTDPVDTDPTMLEFSDCFTNQGQLRPELLSAVRQECIDTFPEQIKVIQEDPMNEQCPSGTDTVTTVTTLQLACGDLSTLARLQCESDVSNNPLTTTFIDIEDDITISGIRFFCLAPDQREPTPTPGDTTGVGDEITVQVIKNDGTTELQNVIGAEAIILYDVIYDGAVNTGDIRAIQRQPIELVELISELALAGTPEGKTALFEWARLIINPVIDLSKSDRSVDIFSPKFTYTWKLDVNNSTLPANFPVLIVDIEAGSTNLAVKEIDDEFRGGTFYQMAVADIQPSQIDQVIASNNITLEDGDTVTLTLTISCEEAEALGNDCFRVRTTVFDSELEQTVTADFAGSMSPMSFVQAWQFESSFDATQEPCQALAGEEQVRCLGDEQPFGSGGTCEGLTSQQCLDANPAKDESTGCKQEVRGLEIVIICYGADQENEEEVGGSYGGNPATNPSGTGGIAAVCPDANTVTECSSAALAAFQKALEGAFTGVTGSPVIQTISNNAILIISAVVAILIIALVIRFALRKRQGRLRQKFGI